MKPDQLPNDPGGSSAATSSRLTRAQRRHLAEMFVEPDEPPMYWTTRRGSAQHRSALALVKRGLLEPAGDHSSWSFNNPGFTLTEAGVELAEVLHDVV